MRTVFFGWRVVAAAFVTASFSWGISFYGPPIFLEVLHRTHGWPSAVIAAAITTHFLAGAALVAKLAGLHRRFGLAPTIRAGAVLSGAGLLCWSGAREAWQLFPAALVSGAGWALLGGAALNAIIAPWFARRRPAALGMAYNGASVGGVLFAPLWVALIGALGFPLAACLVAASCVIALWFLSVRYFGGEPGQMGLVADGEPAPPASAIATRRVAPLGRPWRERRFITLALAATLALVAQVGLIAHLFSYLTPRLGAEAAGLAMGGVTVCAIAGRLLLGALLPQGADRRVVAAVNVAMQAVGSAVLLFGGSVPWILLGSWLFGLGLGNVT
ncbi:MAG TPA: MFS transporter [Acetobacteraceae bacterium]|nr:MFS transporter [Acetobacteraceae bacterium]